MKVSDVMACSFPVWYSQYERITIKSVIIALPDNVLKYFEDGGTIVLPEEIRATDVSSATSESDGGWEHSSESEVAPAPNLKSFTNEIQKAIDSLGGKAFPKLNWSSPKDSAWISFNKSLECTRPADVYLLLKSSTFVAHDLTCPFKDCDDASESGDIDYYLVLRKWVDVNPPDEFRCFVRRKRLVGICQRDSSQYYCSIKPSMKDITRDVYIFWKKWIKESFSLDSYVFDVHRPNPGQVTLIDFGPYGPVTDGLLFTWNELLKRNVPEPQLTLTPLTEVSDASHQCSTDDTDLNDIDFRCVLDDTGIQPSPYMQYGLPVDVLDLSRGTDPLKMVDFLKLRIQDQNEEFSSDEDVIAS